MDIKSPEYIKLTNANLAKIFHSPKLTEYIRRRAEIRRIQEAWQVRIAIQRWAQRFVNCLEQIKTQKEQRIQFKTKKIPGGK